MANDFGHNNQKGEQKMTSNVETAVKCEEDLFCGVNTVKDCEHMTDLEKKRQPIITASRTCPIMKICISLDHTHGKLRAFAHCNLHGT